MSEPWRDKNANTWTLEEQAAVNRFEDAARALALQLGYPRYFAGQVTTLSNAEVELIEALRNLDRVGAKLR